MSTSQRTLSSIETLRCSFPLARPFLLGFNMIDERDYVVLKLVDTDGNEGYSFALARGAPTDLVIAELVGPRFFGLSIDDPGRCQQQVSQSLLPHYSEGLINRALSLIDIAMWDQNGRANNQPVWQLLGGASREMPVLLVEGYPMQDESDTEFVDRVVAKVDDGYQYIKLTYGSADPDAFTRKLRRLAARLPAGAQVCVDVGFIWGDPRVAEDILDAWADLDLLWIEDPAGADNVEAFRGLRQRTRLPLAAGDEVTRGQALADAVSAGVLDVVRIDSTCVGGFTGMRWLAGHVERAGHTVSTHVYPELNLHGACGLTAAGPIEMFPPGNPWDTAWQFVQPPSPVLQNDRRVLRPTGVPGLGLEIDWDRVTSATVRRSHISPA
jgi:L-alanine-DL-glutamate epimerase-like enolase superfamily enzyme